jgi:hypothetical protein
MPRSNTSDKQHVKADPKKLIRNVAGKLVENHPGDRDYPPLGSVESDSCYVAPIVPGIPQLACNAALVIVSTASPLRGQKRAQNL